MSIVDKMKKNKLKWFRHVMKQEETKAINVVMKRRVEGKRRRRIPKKRWLDTIENDIKAVGVCVSNVENRDNWRFRTKVAQIIGSKVKKKKKNS
jgi:hypothetical protein